jgi:CheY-like chemotaxis protein
MLKQVIDKDVTLETLFDPQLDNIKVDPVQIEQIAMNLAVNARDAMAQGGKLIIQTTNVKIDDTPSVQNGNARAGSYVALIVSDTGCGMDPAIIPHVFEPFFTTKGSNGTGLGLSTVYGIVKESGGHISIASEVGRGTTFRIYFPRVVGELDVVASPVLSEKGGHETILLVEDEVALRNIAKQLLARKGYTVLPAGSASEALKIVDTYPGMIHLLLTDIVMPEYNGRQLAELIAKDRPSIQVLFMSGYSPDWVSHGLPEESAHYIQKPFTAEGLTSKVRSILDSRQSGSPELHRCNS